MKPEYKYIMIVGFWLALWTFLPILALPLFIVVVVRHFVLLRRQRKQTKVAEVYHSHDKKWAKMEGFEVSELEDSADWWKK